MLTMIPKKTKRKKKNKKTQESKKKGTALSKPHFIFPVLDANECVIIRVPLENWYTGIMKKHLKGYGECMKMGERGLSVHVLGIS